MVKLLKKFSVIAVLLVITGCQPKIPLEALQLSSESLANRQLQTRLYETEDILTIMKASAQVLQDLGFTIDDHEAKLGLLVASKTRDATNGGQVALSILSALFTGVATPVDSHQVIRVSMVVRPFQTLDVEPVITDAKSESDKKVQEPINSEVRITFQRLIYNTKNAVTTAEQIQEAEVYQDFFESLSKSVFLEAQSL